MMVPGYSPAPLFSPKYIPGNTITGSFSAARLVNSMAFKVSQAKGRCLPCASTQPMGTAQTPLHSFTASKKSQDKIFSHSIVFLL